MIFVLGRESHYIGPRRKKSLAFEEVSFLKIIHSTNNSLSSMTCFFDLSLQGRNILLHTFFLWIIYFKLELELFHKVLCFLNIKGNFINLPTYKRNAIVNIT